MEGLFVSSSVRPVQGWTDFGYYVDGDRVPRSGDDLEEMVREDEAYRVEIFVNYKEGVHVRLRSENRREFAEVNEKVGFRKRGLETTLYKSTGSPRLPSTYADPEKQSRSLTAFAKYVLDHEGSDGVEIKNLDWENILEDDSGL